MALYGVSTADANAVIGMAIGGKAVTELYEGVRRFQIRIRFPEEYRTSDQDIGNLPAFYFFGIQSACKRNCDNNSKNRTLSDFQG